MNFISRDTDYAVRALVYMTVVAKKKNSVITVDEIAREEDLPERFLRRILQGLAKNKILSSYKGKQGGFSFLKSPENIKLTDVIKVFQGEVKLTNCLLKGSICPELKTCALRKKLNQIERSVNKKLRNITITSLS